LIILVQQKIGNAVEALRNSPPEQLLEKELSRLLDLAVRGLSPQQQLVYRLSREEELTYEQISLRLGISKETTKTHMKEALKSIRNYIRRHADLGCLILAIILREK
jgi:RNA polymerase sigma factor (sigma-70 family)